jgi:hypothetical protein
MATRCGPALVLACLGCQQVWLVAPESPEKEGSPDAAETPRHDRTTQLERSKKLLVGRLDAVEEQLARGRGAGDLGDKLRDERLVLNVALMVIDQDIAEVQRGERSDTSTVEQRLVQAQASIEQARKRLASGEVVVDGRLGWATTLEVGGQPKVLSLGERDRATKAERRRGKGRASCSPGDPLCGGMDGWDGEGDGDGDEPSPPNERERAAAFKPPARYPAEGKPDSKDGDPNLSPPPADRGAARVSHAKAPEGVGRTVARHRGELLACLPPSLRPQGLRLRVRARLDAQGAFREPRVVATDIDPPVAGCIADVFRQMRVPGHDGGSRMITVPLWLSSDP